jgi:hypothetical protein
MFPNYQVFVYVVPAFECLLPLAWAYAFWKLAPDARMSTARLAVVPR